MHIIRIIFGFTYIGGCVIDFRVCARADTDMYLDAYGADFECVWSRYIHDSNELKYYYELLLEGGVYLSQTRIMSKHVDAYVTQESLVGVHIYNSGLLSVSSTDWEFSVAADHVAAHIKNNELETGVCIMELMLYTYPGYVVGIDEPRGRPMAETVMDDAQHISGLPQEATDYIDKSIEYRLRDILDEKDAELQEKQNTIEDLQGVVAVLKSEKQKTRRITRRQPRVVGV